MYGCDNTPPQPPLCRTACRILTIQSTFFCTHSLSIYSIFLWIMFNYTQHYNDVFFLFNSLENILFTRNGLGIALSKSISMRTLWKYSTWVEYASKLWWNSPCSFSHRHFISVCGHKSALVLSSRQLIGAVQCMWREALEQRTHLRAFCSPFVLALSLAAYKSLTCIAPIFSEHTSCIVWSMFSLFSAIVPVLALISLPITISPTSLPPLSLFSFSYLPFFSHLLNSQCASLSIPTQVVSSRHRGSLSVILYQSSTLKLFNPLHFSTR